MRPNIRLQLESEEEPTTHLTLTHLNNPPQRPLNQPQQPPKPQRPPLTIPPLTILTILTLTLTPRKCKRNPSKPLQPNKRRDLLHQRRQPRKQAPSLMLCREADVQARFEGTAVKGGEGGFGEGVGPVVLGFCQLSVR